MAILVTGGSSGIGRAIAERFAEPGNDVFINYHRDDDAASGAAAAIEARGARAHVLKADVGDPEQVAALMAQVRATVDRLDQIVHAAAFAVGGPLLELDPHTLRHALSVNAVALVDLVREGLPVMGRGSAVLFVSSRGSRLAIPGYGALGTAKALAEHIVRYLAVEVAPHGIRVNAISPGAVDTAAFRSMFPDTWQRRLEAAAKANPSGRMTEMTDITDVVAQLARPEFAWVQGQTIAIDGGAGL